MMQFREHVPLAPMTTLGVGGGARWFAEAGTEADVAEAAAFARELGLPLFALGGGSNVLAADSGFSGVVLRIGLSGVEFGEGTLRAAAGEEWDRLVSAVVGRGWAGVECLAGIPGRVGGTPVQNVGAYGQEVAETITEVRAFDLESRTYVNLAANKCGFGYRRSIFNSTHRGRYIVTAVSYALSVGGRARVAYTDLKRFFADRNEVPSLAEVAAAVRQIRLGKGMLLVEGDADCRSAGSFFKNPVVTREHYEQIAAESGGAAPSYPADDHRVKLPAAWLVEQAGFHKGYAMGRAGISTRHTLALVNRGGATADEIMRLRDAILKGVQQRFGIVLEPEPVLLA